MRKLGYTSLVFLFVSCAGTSPPPADPTPPDDKTDPPPDTPPDAPDKDEPKLTQDLIERSCKHFTIMNESNRCGARLDYAGCVASLSNNEGRQEWELSLRAKTLECVIDADTCSAMSACFAEEQRAITAKQGPRKCGEERIGPIELGQVEADARYGLKATKYSDVKTTQEKPVEVCGLDGQLGWLVKLQCDDGSHPFSNNRAAHASRSGNTGVGGRCNSTIDLYEVSCPEKTYSIHIDMYMCGPGESP